MYHSITFGNKNTWDDWKLLPETQPIVVMPTQKTNYIDIPGASGSLDMSDALTGYPVYNNREGSFNFLITNNAGVLQPENNRKKIHRVVEDIAEYIHGKTMKMILEDDPLYYYEGRFSVGDFSPEEGFSKVTINYNLEPYKWSIFNSVDTDWLWDPFNFETGIIMKGMYSSIPATTTTQSLTIPAKMFGTAPIQPLFYMAKKSTSNYWNIRCTYDDRSYSSGNLTSVANYVFDDFVVSGKDLTVYYYCSGTGGTLSINFRPGRL